MPVRRRTRHPQAIGTVCFRALLGAAIVVSAVAPAAAQPTAVARPVTTEELQRLVNDLGLQLQLTMRGRTAEHERRYEALAAALDAWKKSGRSDADAFVMKAWLDQAIFASMPGSRSPMPAAPVFDAPQSVAPPVMVAQQERIPTPTPTTTPSAASPAPAEWAPPVAAASPFDDIPIEDPMPFESPVARSPRVEESADETALGQTPVAQTPVAQTPIAEEPVFDEPGFDEPIFDEPTFDEPANEPAVAEARPVDPPAEITPLADEPLASLNEHPAAANLDWGDPFVDDPLPEETAAEGPVRTTTLKPPAEVELDLDELSARSRGYARGLKKVEADLVATPNPTAFRLAAIARELESLQSQRGLIEIYLRGLSELDRFLVDDLPPSEGVIDRLQAAVNDRAANIANQSTADAAAERAVLEGLKRKLRSLQAPSVAAAEGR